MASTVQFTPTFEHQDWVDNVDRVTAGGPNGFNGRFNALQADLNQMTDVVKTINTALQARPPSIQLIDTNVSIPAFVAGQPGSGTRDVPLGGSLPISSHAFHQISVSPDSTALNVAVNWMEVAMAPDTGAAPRVVVRMLRLQHQSPNPVTVAVRVLRLQF
jgi:hypothetical protein